MSRRGFSAMLQRLATFRRGSAAVVVDFGDGAQRLRRVDLAALRDPARFIRDLIARRTAQPVHVHENRDGSYAVAVGNEPNVWPEDERDE